MTRNQSNSNIINTTTERSSYRERARTLPCSLTTSDSSKHLVQRNLNTFLLIPSLDEMRKTLRQLSNTPPGNGGGNAHSSRETPHFSSTSKQQQQQQQIQYQSSSGYRKQSSYINNNNNSRKQPFIKEEEEEKPISSFSLSSNETQLSTHQQHNYALKGARSRRGVVISLGVDQLRYTIIEPDGVDRKWQIRSYASILRRLNELLGY